MVANIPPKRKKVKGDQKNSLNEELNVTFMSRLRQRLIFELKGKILCLINI